MSLWNFVVHIIIAGTESLRKMIVSELVGRRTQDFDLSRVVAHSLLNLLPDIAILGSDHFLVRLREAVVQELNHEPQRCDINVMTFKGKSACSLPLPR